ncbi:MAG: ribonuclease P protein component [Rhodoplanes sp.]|uniref:ribonuclease P protein component n=1 Tax=Rhodoplanes sp. TaxID=1968906 RepID=UPI0017D9E6E7|nr:ribonuclease P protein component [Rhodoplanes sp.]NVO15413.1 ribonuclease P protein component [Rhodoplanes sp.]
MQRLRQRSDFLAAAKGAKAPTPAFVLQARARSDHDPPRVGFTVTKKVGTAVERNRVRRRLREVVRLSAAGRLRNGNDYVMIGRRAALDRPFDRCVADFIGAIKRVHRPPREPDQPARDGAPSQQPDPRPTARAVS